MLPVTYDDVRDAQFRVHAVLKPTALIQWPGLSGQLGCNLFLKHENHQPVGAFKVRGGVNLVSRLTPSERAGGILGCSTGNHGQSLAFACRRFGARCTIVVPEGNNPDKNRAMRLLGAELIEHGCDFDEAREYLEKVVQPKGGRYVHSANEPMLIAGVGTMACEIFEQLPDPDVILVPIGLGSGVCGTGIVTKHLRPEAKVIGVQAAGASTIHDGWQRKQPMVGDRPKTFAEGVATRQTYELTFGALCDGLADFVLISDTDMAEAMRLIWRTTHHLVEPAGAAGIAAVSNLRKQLAGQTIVVILSGANVDGQTARRVFAGEI